MNCTLQQILLGWSNQGEEMGWACSTMGKLRNLL